MEDLKRIRKGFVQNASIATLKGLLDDLWEVKVLNTDDKDTVLEAQTIRADRARCLIDMVIGKGERASQALINYSLERDKYLYFSLGLILPPRPTDHMVQSSDSGGDAETQGDSRHGGDEEVEDKEEYGAETSKETVKGLGDGKTVVKSKKRTRGQELSDEQLRAVAKTLGWKWERAAIHLGLKDKEVDKIKKEEKEFMQRRNMLQVWKRQNSGKATAQDLQRGLEDLEDLPVETHQLLKGLGDGKTVVKPKKRTRGKKLSDEQLRAVAKTLGQKWKQAAIHLGLNNNDLYKIKKEKKEFMQRRNMLQLWKGRSPEKATAQDLLRGLKDLKDLPVKTRQLLKGLGDGKTVVKPKKGTRDSSAAIDEEEEVSPTETQGRTSELIHSSEQFKTEKLKDRDNIYPVMAKDTPRMRVALLITNVHFEHFGNRDGAEKDEEDMSKLLRALGYIVEPHRDLSGPEMDEAVKRFSQDPRLSRTDSVFVVIMSHGVKGAILGVKHSDADPDQFPIDNIYKHLDSNHCRKLVDKPKVIIIQACRGDKDGSAMVMDGPGSVPEQAPVVQVDAAPPPHLANPVDEDIEADAHHRVHIEKDLVSFLSCTADTVSYRHTTKGSFFIQHIVEIFNRHAHEDHIMELFRKVLKRFEDEPPSPMTRQMPVNDRASLPRLFYLFPGY